MPITKRKNRVQVNVWISENHLKALRDSCTRSITRIAHGELSSALEEAIHLYLTQRGYVFNGTEFAKPTSVNFGGERASTGNSTGSSRVPNFDSTLGVQPAPDRRKGPESAESSENTEDGIESFF